MVYDYRDPNDPDLYPDMTDETGDDAGLDLVATPLADDDLIDDPDALTRTYDPATLSPTPPNQGAHRTSEDPEGIERVAAWLGRVSRQASEGLWAVAAAGWRHPVRAAALVAGAVWLTRVTLWGVLAGAAACAALVWLVSSSAIRRERIASLLAQSVYHKRKARVRRRWAKLWHNAGLTSTSLTPGGPKRQPKYAGTRPHRHGVTVLIRGEDVAVGPRELTEAAHSLTETVGALSMRAVREPPKTLLGFFEIKRGRTRVDFKFDDPFPALVLPSDLPPPSGPGLAVIGLDEEGHGVEKSVVLPSLVVGAPGSGKSSEVWMTLRALREAGIPFRLRVFDPKGGMELGDLREAAYIYESNPGRWPQFLRRACAALQERQRDMARRGMRKIPYGDPDWPLDIMIIDELVTVLSVSKGADSRITVFGQEMTALQAFTVYLSQIRSAGATCIALTQLPEKNVIGAARGMFAYVSCLRVGPTESEAVDMLLGRGAHHAYPAHELPADESSAGKGWVRTKAGIIMYRSAFLDDAERAEEARLIALATARYSAERDAEQARVEAERAAQPESERPRRGRRRRSRDAGSAQGGGGAGEVG